MNKKESFNINLNMILHMNDYYRKPFPRCRYFRHFLLTCLIILCTCSFTACGSAKEEGLSDRGYEIGTEVVDAAEQYVNKDLDAETINNKIVPLSLDAEREDAQLYEYIIKIIGDICGSSKEDDIQIEKDIDTLRDYIGYPAD